MRSPLQPEEVRGLSRSGELSRMLPSEMALLAHGWPRKVAAAVEGAAGGGGGAVASRDGGDGSELIEEEYYLPGARAALVFFLLCLSASSVLVDRVCFRCVHGAATLCAHTLYTWQRAALPALS